MRRLLLLALVAIAAARYVDNVRDKREVDLHDWLTEAQKSELKMLKESADHAALKKRTMELYELLPADEKEKWNGKYKEMCVAWIKEVATEEENNNYKKWKAEGKMDEITAQYKKLKDRLSEHKRKDVELWENECWNLWKDEFPAASRGRRSLMDLAEEKLSFLGTEKLTELKQLKESGASDDVIRDKVVSWTLEHWKSADKSLSTADFVNKCYGWIKDVTQAEEYAAFEKLHHTDHEACRVKVREFLARLPLEKQTAVEKSLPLCDAIWYKQHQEEHGAHAGHGDHDHHAHKHHGKRHLNTEHIEKFMGWMSKEQKDEIKKMEAGGESYEALVQKMKSYYEELEGDKKADVREDLKEKCAEWVMAKTTETEQYQLNEYIDNADKDGLLTELKKAYARLTDDEKHEVDHTKDMCLQLWTTEPDRRRRSDNSEAYKQYLSWLTPEQGAETKALRDAGKDEDAHKKVLEYYDALAGEKKNEATEKLKGACKHFFNDNFGAAAVEEVKLMKESGTSMDDIGKKVEELISKIDDEKKRAVATRVSVSCKKIFSASRRRRDHHDEYAAYKEYFTWLTPEQAAEVKKLREEGKEEDAHKKVHEFLGALEGDKKTEATEKLKGACRHFFKDSFGDAAVEEFKALKESGSSIDDIAAKVNELIAKIPDEKKKAVATRASVNCKSLFAGSRKRRDHHEEYKEYFSWLTPEQGAEIKALKEAGDQEGVYKKTEEFYEALVGDKKTEATEKLKGACKHFFNKAFGDDAVEEIKQMKESGSSMDDIGKKVEEFIGKITDDKKKAVAVRASANCKKVFSASRKRRDHHDEYAAYKEYFTWLTPEQAAEIKTLKESGDTEAINKKVGEWHGALEGDKKVEATEKLKGACKHFFKDNFGEAAVEEVKQMKESGSSMDDIAKKVEGFIAKISDDKKKASAERVSVTCKKIFSAARKRRELDEFAAYKEYFTWLTPEQAAAVKALQVAGDEDGANKKVHEFFAALEGDKKTEAAEKLKGACRHFFKDVFGAAAVEEVKQMKESGTSMDVIDSKVTELIAKIADEKKKATATRAAGNCKKLFVSRRRREHKHSMDEALTEFLPWLSDAQQAELKTLKESGADDKVGEKIMEFYESVDESQKEVAKSKLQAGCRHFLGHLIGEAATAEMKALKESGASVGDMAAKLEEVIGKMPEGADKTKAIGMSKNCKKVYGVAARKRRHEHTLEEGFTEFLPWISEEQKMELKNMKEAGAADKMGDKIIEYYENVDADKKEEARNKLQAGCRHYLKHLLGDAVAGEMKTMHESGAKPAEMATKLDEIINKMEDGEKKTKAARLSKNCRKVYGVDARKRRDLYGEYDSRYHQYYNWLDDDQKEELMDLQESGEDSALLQKVSQYFADLSAAKKDEVKKFI